MKVIKVNPEGICNGVKYSLKTCLKALKNANKPLYLLGPIIHNEFVNNALEKQGIIILNDTNQNAMIDNISRGTLIVPAFGIDSYSLKKAKDKGLTIVDATCPIVANIHKEINLKKNNKQILYIGSFKHPEARAIYNEDRNLIFINSKEDINQLDKNKSYFITNQTTLSLNYVSDLIDYAKKTLPNLEVTNNICKATSLRQKAIDDIKGNLIIVVGDINSTNTNKLSEIAKNNNPNSLVLRIQILDDLKNIDLKNFDEAYITSGASTPTAITEEIISYLENYPKKKAISKLTDSDYLKF